MLPPARPPTQDQIGGFGEDRFKILITAHPPGEGPRFKPQFLGEKWDALDFLVQLETDTIQKPFFFVQVKTTTKGYAKKLKRLKIPTLSQEKIESLIAFPAPTYLVGINYSSGEGYIVSVNGEKADALSSLSTAYSLQDQKVLDDLWDEVMSFWAGYTPLTSKFTDADWK